MISGFFYIAKVDQFSVILRDVCLVFYNEIPRKSELSKKKKILGQMADKEPESLNTICPYYLGLIIAHTDPQ